MHGVADAGCEDGFTDAGPSIWYRIVGREGSLVKVSICDEDSDTNSGIFISRSGYGTCEERTCYVYQRTDGGSCMSNPEQASVTFEVDEGVVYFIQVVTFGNFGADRASGIIKVEEDRIR